MSSALGSRAPLLDCEVAREPAAVAVGRRAVAGWLDEVGVDPDRRRDVVTVASELLTLGVLYGARSSMNVTAASVARDVYVEVATFEHAETDEPPEHLVDPELGLRSLCIVHGLVDGMSVRARGDESLVCCRFDGVAANRAVQGL